MTSLNHAYISLINPLVVELGHYWFKELTAVKNPSIIWAEVYLAEPSHPRTCHW